MSSFPESPRLNKAGIVIIDPDTGLVDSHIALQYNPETLSRSFEISDTVPSVGGDKSQALRITGPAVETLSLEAILDATDSLEVGDTDAVELGVHRELAVIESLLQPDSSALLGNHRLADSGALEILPMEKKLTVFVWGRQRILPIRITALSVTEEAFSPDLNPLRATVSLSMRVLSIDDLGFAHRGGSLYMAYLQNKEALRNRAESGDFSTLGIGDSL